MSTFDATSEANKAVTDAKNADKNPGKDKDAGIKALVKDMNSVTSDNTLSASDKAAYFKQVNDQLSKAGLVPELSMEYGDANFKTLSQNGSKLTSGSIDSVVNQGSSSVTLDATTAPNEVVQTLSNQLKTDVGSGGKNQGDLQSDLTKEQAQAYNRQLMAPLFQGNPPLYQQLDNAAGKSKGNDGTIGSADIDAYLAQAKNNPDDYPKDQVAFVQSLKNGLTYHGTNGKDSSYKFNSDSLNPSTLAENLGLDENTLKSGNYSKVLDNYNSKVASDNAGSANVALDPTSTSTILGSLQSSKDVTFDSNGNATISASQLADLQKTYANDPQELATLNSMSESYGTASGGIDLDKVTQSVNPQYASTPDAYSAALGENGDLLPANLNAAQKASVQTLLSNPTALKALEDSSGNITQASLGTYINEHAQEGDVTAADALLSTFNNVKTGDSIRPDTLAGSFNYSAADLNNEPVSSLSADQKTAIQNAITDKTLSGAANGSNSLSLAQLQQFISATGDTADTTAESALVAAYNNLKGADGNIDLTKLSAQVGGDGSSPTSSTSGTSGDSTKLGTYEKVSAGGSYYSTAESILGKNSGTDVDELVGALEKMNNNKALNPNDQLFSSPQDLVNYLNGDSSYSDALKAIESQYGVQPAAS